MPTPENLAARFARCVSLFRDLGAKDQQKLEFRALVGLLRQTAVTIQVADGRLVLNDAPCKGEGLPALVQRMELHGIREIAVAQDAPPAQLFALLTALADQPGANDFATRLAGAGADRIRVVATPVAPGAGRAAPSSASGESGAGVPPASTGVPTPPSPRRAVPPAAEPTAARASLPPDAAQVLVEIERDPLHPDVGDLLAAVVRHAETAIKQARWEQMLGLIGGVIQVEQRVPEASGMRRQYGIAMRRLYTKPALQGLARLLATPKHRAAAVVALQRGGAAAVEVLMDILVAAPTVSERRAVFDALKQMTEGTEQLVHMLDHPEWFVVRNVAELLGELGMDEAVPALGRRLNHADDRVRKGDRSPDVRLQVAVGIGRKASALAMPLVVAMEEEKDEGIVRELLLALGRIGSAEAVQALIKWAQPSGRIFRRRPSALRVAAVEGLRLAATPAALGTLEGLSDDGDRQVREAAQSAVLELKRPPRP